MQKHPEITIFQVDFGHFRPMGGQKSKLFSPVALSEVDFGHFRPTGAQKLKLFSPAALNELNFGHFQRARSLRLTRSCSNRKDRLSSGAGLNEQDRVNAH